ncbi:MAG: hypothetical protein WAN32_22350, partial [Candidatus Acidiferrum sp.]
LLYGIFAAWRFRDYKPLPVTFGRAKKWLEQFRGKDRRAAGVLLEKVVYLSEKTTRSILVQQNHTLMNRLAEAGLPADKLIYVQVHDAGSSSPVMLNLLRDAAGLDRLGCHFVDAHDSLKLNKITNEVGTGALIYVDDFVGTGNQFCKERQFASQSVVGTFSEFLLVPCICEEGIYKIAKEGVEAFAGHVHSKAERPLHENSHLLDPDAKQRMREMCKGISAKMGLGYNQLATMVILYRNAPNTVPSVFLGSPNQAPFAGLFPRWKDLPIPNQR